MEEEIMATLNVEKIIHRTSPRGEFFKVVWADGTDTTIKLAEGDTSDEYTAFLYCLGKRLFKDKGKAREFIRGKKKVFEDEVAAKSALNRVKRLESNLMRDVEEEEELVRNGLIPITSVGFIPVPTSALSSKSIYRRNQQ